jgi:arsenate reductase-like glutaredoxin family protein
MKNQYIKFRVSEPEKERIEGMAKRSGTTVSEYCRQQSLTGRILAAPKLSSEEISYFRALKEHNNGLARLANIIRNKLPGLANAIAEYLEQSKELYSRFF